MAPFGGGCTSPARAKQYGKSPYHKGMSIDSNNKYYRKLQFGIGAIWYALKQNILTSEAGMVRAKRESKDAA